MSENFEAPDLNIDQLVDTDPSESAEWRASFDAALKAGKVKVSTSKDTCIHRAWSKTKLHSVAYKKESKVSTTGIQNSTNVWTQ
jgi:hypothetical protein